MRTLFSWIGRHDLAAAKQNQPDIEPGPVLRLLRHVTGFGSIHLLNDIFDPRRDEATPAEFVEWLQSLVEGIRPFIHPASASMKNNYGAAYQFTLDTIRNINRSEPDETDAGFLLSPGWPSGQVGMILVAQQLFRPDRVKLYNTWPPRMPSETGWEEIRLPFALSIDRLFPDSRVRIGLAELPIDDAFATIHGESDAIKRAKQLATRVAPFDVSVVLHGESGTGKDLFARAIHACSPRKGQNFVAINCAAVPESLLESELFGHVKGAFTGATTAKVGLLKEADQGTLFLDEIGDMPLSLQVKLLRFLQDGTFRAVGDLNEQDADVRVIAATHRDLDATVRAGRFRGDLLYRIDQVRVTLPSLRERGNDIGQLADSLLKRFFDRHRIKTVDQKQFDDDARSALNRLPWPGNVRELENAVVRLAIFVDGPTITGDDVAFWVRPPVRSLVQPLRQSSLDELLTHAAAVMDELIERFDSHEFRPEGSYFDGVIEPLIAGRAYYSLGQENAARAGKLLGYKFDASRGKADARRLAVYTELFQKRIDENRVTQLRGGEE